MCDGQTDLNTTRILQFLDDFLIFYRTFDVNQVPF